MRARYCATRARQVRLPLLNAACTSAIEVSSTRNCADAEVVNTTRRAAVSKVLMRGNMAGLTSRAPSRDHPGVELLNTDYTEHTNYTEDSDTSPCHLRSFVRIRRRKCGSGPKCRRKPTSIVVALGSSAVIVR